MSPVLDERHRVHVPQSRFLIEMSHSGRSNEFNTNEHRVRSNSFTPVKFPKRPEAGPCYLRCLPSEAIIISFECPNIDGVKKQYGVPAMNPFTKHLSKPSINQQSQTFEFERHSLVQCFSRSILSIFRLNGLKDSCWLIVHRNKMKQTGRNSSVVDF